MPLGVSAIHLDGAQMEAFTPVNDGAMSLMLDDDFVRDAQTIRGQTARSPWIEEHPVYKQPQSALDISRLIAYAGNHLARGLRLADLIA